MFDWRNFHALAKEFMTEAMSNGTTDERRKTLLRIAISRAYYAAYHECRIFLESWGKKYDRSQNEDTGPHEYVINYLDEKKEENTSLSLELQRAFKSRKKADYSDVFNGIEKEAETTVSRTSRIISEIELRKKGPY